MTTRVVRSIVALVALGSTSLLLADCAAQARLPASTNHLELTLSEARGQDIAARRCAVCHALRPGGVGSGDDPPLASLAFRYNAISLERRVAEVSAHGSGRMPPARLSSA